MHCFSGGLANRCSHTVTPACRSRFDFKESFPRFILSFKDVVFSQVICVVEYGFCCVFPAASRELGREASKVVLSSVVSMVGLLCPVQVQHLTM